MPDPKEQKPNLPLIGVVLLVATVGGVYFYGKPFESFRPREGVIETSSTLGPQFVPARLWEDPFTAVSKRFGQQPDQKGPMGMFQYAPNHSADHLKKQIKKQAKEHGTVTIMPVMVFGGPYAEQIEDRRRKRYAVLSALAVADYEPVDSEHIDYLQIPWDPWPLNSKKQADDADPCPLNESSPGSPSQKGCLVVPYEWLLAKGSASKQYGAVLLLWLDNNLFDDHPLLRLERLIKRVIEKGPKNEPSIKIIGPAGSTTLRAMVQEASQSAASFPRSKWIEIYSPNATAPDTMLISENDTKTEFQRSPSVGNKTTCENDRAESNARDYISRAFERLGITFRRTIPTDHDLACALREELGRRRVTLEPPENPNEEPKNHIVLIAEWDTFYGRSLPETFSKVFTRPDEENKAQKAPCTSSGVCLYSYMRGLDGETPLQEKEAAKTSKEAGEVKRDSQILERAIGNSQFDYLRRLGSRIEREMEEMKGNVRAIGVLGSDVYDKLLILQALHDLFPSALFFTTDLDARYAHRAESKWTRNLIVGSGFGLELHSERQGEIPSFRDSYQTAVFYAVQEALKEPSQAQAERLTPRLFEIGRRQPVDLSVDQEQEQDPDPVHPERVMLNWQKSPAVFIIKIVGFVVLILLLLGMVNWLRRGLAIWSVIVIIAPILLIGWLVTQHDALQGEPLDVLEGISLWPSEAIRLYAVLLALGFIWQGAWSLRNSNRGLSQQYNLDIKSDPPECRTGVGDGALRRRLRMWVSQYLPPWQMVASDQRLEENSVQKLWTEHRKRCRFWRTLLRVFVSSAVYLILVGGIFFTGFLGRTPPVLEQGDFSFRGAFIAIFSASPTPVVPGRGEVSFLSDKLILWSAIILLVGLIFFVVDATRLCRQFIERLCCKQLQWSPQTLEKFAIHRSMSAHPDDLSEWLAIQLIAERTRVVGRLVYYPFIVLLLMIVARSHLLDRWSQPWFLLFVFGLNAAWVIGCAVALRNRAEKSRQQVLDSLNRKLFQSLESEPARIGRLRLLIQEVEANRDGAFCPLSEQPVIRTILFFLGGSGGLIFLEYLIQSR